MRNIRATVYPQRVRGSAGSVVRLVASIDCKACKRSSVTHYSSLLTCSSRHMSYSTTNGNASINN